MSPAGLSSTPDGGLLTPSAYLYYSQVHPSSLCSSPLIPTEESPSTRQDGFRRQNNILRLRKAGFKGSNIALRRVSPESKAPPPSGSVQRNDETACCTVGDEERKPSTGHSPSTPLRILADVSNSASRQARSLSPIDPEIFTSLRSSGKQALKLSSKMTHTQDIGPWAPCSRLTSPSEDMKLREITLNPKTPPSISKSPIAKHIKGCHKRNLNLRTASFESSKYIEHLESEIVALQTQLQSMNDPSTSKSHLAKLRALNADSRALRQEVLDWEHKFEERLRTKLQDHGISESKHQNRNRYLEKEIQTDQVKLKDLEAEVQSLRQLNKTAEGLSSENENLRRRLELMSELRTKSPVSQGLMPVHAELILPFCSNNIDQDSETTYETRNTLISSLTTSAREHLLEPRDPHKDLRQSCRSRELNSPLLPYNFSSSASSCTSQSRPSSMVSESSVSPVSFVLSQQREPTCSSHPSSQRKRMRRFPSGNCALKELILPNSSLPTSFPTSAPATTIERPWNEDTPKARGKRSLALGRAFSKRSLEGDEGHHSLPWDDTSTLQTLEANSPPNVSRWLLASDEDRALKEEKGETCIPRRLAHTRCQSLFTELSNAEALESTAISPSTDGKARELLNQRSKSSLELLDESSRINKPPTTLHHAHDRNVESRSSATLIEMWLDPCLLAKTIISNAWARRVQHRSIIGIGWKLLYLIVGPVARGRRKMEHIGRFDFEWNEYSIDASRERLVGHKKESRPSTSISNERFSATTKARECLEGEILSCPDCCQPSTPERFWIWVKFSVAIALAIGVAVRNGPQALFTDAAVLEDKGIQDYENETGT
ncbi:MAG: hypothetical protein M1824_002496 [Vezdaea acicularis]|nr:MAG: hypothetical protein M1824_002496 [Vezdaea acicularis]